MRDRRVTLSPNRTPNRKFPARAAAIAGGAVAVAAIAAAGVTAAAGGTGHATTTTSATTSAPAARRGPAALAAAPPAAAVPAGHPGPAAPRRRDRPAAYTVKPGDTLTAITGRLFGHPGLWTRLYAANATIIGADPGQITPGERLTVKLARHGKTGQVTTARAGAPRQPDPAPAQQPLAATQPAAAPAAAQAPTAPTGAAPGGSFGACVRSRESGGNYQATNGGGYYGAYQFSASTWAAYGGNPADFGHASAAEQDQVFATALARGGQSNWAAYDGC